MPADIEPIEVPIGPDPMRLPVAPNLRDHGATCAGCRCEQARQLRDGIRGMTG